MAGKGGGAWKVAYADFVTALMAFFMVMWLISQDQKVKESIARYFVDPVGFKLTGSKSSPGAAGAIYDSPFAGPVPGERNRSVGRGFGAVPTAEPEADETTVAAEWLLGETQREEHWMSRAKLIREQVRLRPFRDTVHSPDEQVRQRLAREMRSETSTRLLAETEGLAQDLLAEALSRIDWNVLAEHCLDQLAPD